MSHTTKHFELGDHDRSARSCVVVAIRWRRSHLSQLTRLTYSLQSVRCNTSRLPSVSLSDLAPRRACDAFHFQHAIEIEDVSKCVELVRTLLVLLLVHTFAQLHGCCEGHTSA